MAELFVGYESAFLLWRGMSYRSHQHSRFSRTRETANSIARFDLIMREHIRNAPKGLNPMRGVKSRYQALEMPVTTDPQTSNQEITHADVGMVREIKVEQ